MHGRIFLEIGCEGERQGEDGAQKRMPVRDLPLSHVGVMRSRRKDGLSLLSERSPIKNPYGPILLWPRLFPATAYSGHFTSRLCRFSLGAEHWTGPKNENFGILAEWILHLCFFMPNGEDVVKWFPKNDPLPCNKVLLRNRVFRFGRPQGRA